MMAMEMRIFKNESDAINFVKEIAKDGIITAMNKIGFDDFGNSFEIENSTT